MFESELNSLLGALWRASFSVEAGQKTLWLISLPLNPGFYLKSFSLLNFIDFWTSQNRFFSSNFVPTTSGSRFPLFSKKKQTNKAPISSAHFRELDFSHPKGQFLNFRPYLASSVLFSDPKSHLSLTINDLHQICIKFSSSVNRFFSEKNRDRT